MQLFQTLFDPIFGVFSRASMRRNAGRIGRSYRIGPMPLSTELAFVDLKFVFRK